MNTTCLANARCVRDGEMVTRSEPRPTPEWRRLRDKAKEVAARVIIIDVSRLVDDENNETLAGFIGVSGHLAAETGAAVIVSHHPTKEASKGSDSRPESARGGGALISNCRTAVALFPVAGKEKLSDYLAAAVKAADLDPHDENVLVLEHASDAAGRRRVPASAALRPLPPWGSPPTSSRSRIEIALGSANMRSSQWS